MRARCPRRARHRARVPRRGGDRARRTALHRRVGPRFPSMQRRGAPKSRTKLLKVGTHRVERTGPRWFSPAIGSIRGSGAAVAPPSTHRHQYFRALVPFAAASAPPPDQVSSTASDQPPGASDPGTPTAAPRSAGICRSSGRTSVLISRAMVRSVASGRWISVSVGAPVASSKQNSAWSP